MEQDTCLTKCNSLFWARGRRAHILYGKGKVRRMSACTLHYCTFVLSLCYHLPTTHPYWYILYHAGASSSPFHITLSRRLWTTIPRANLERLDEHASTDRLFREQVHAELPAEIPCIIINLPLLFLAQRIVYSWRDKPMSFKKNFSEAILLKRKSQLQGCPINLRSVR